MCAFNNAKIINWLKTRGMAIKNEKWDLLDDINDTIRLNLKKDSVLLDQLQRPCAVFVTMNSEEGYNRAALYNDTVEMQDFQKFKYFLGQEIDLKEAVEPSDIIWENRNFSESTRTYKKLVVFIVVLILLGMSFSIIFLCQKKSLAFKNKYPRVKCAGYADNYGNHHDEWKHDAIKEYIINKKLEFSSKATNYEGTM